MRNNFKCKSCGAESYAYHYIYKKDSDGKNAYYTKNNKILTCLECKKNKMEYLEDTTKEFGVPNFGKFSSSSREEKVKMLKSRSKENFNKKIKEKKHHMDTKKEYLNGE